MIDGKYDIIMKTPMGAKKGTAILHVNGNSVSGCLDVLGNSNTFENGTVNRDSCTFSGELKTAMGKIAYVVEGNVDGDTLTGTSKTKKGDFKITGKRIAE